MQLSAEADDALLELLRLLDEGGYVFVTPTPETHHRILRRRAVCEATDLRDALGWGLPFAADRLPAAAVALLERAGAVTRTDGLLRSTLGVSSLAGSLFLRSAYPSVEKEAVFLGPDSYRFARFIEAELAGGSGAKWLVDIGTGAGVGAIVAAQARQIGRIVMTDINRLALRLAAVNARFAGVEAELVESPGLRHVDGSPDLVLANPPYMADEDGRTYRDGGDMRGARLSLDWANEAAERLARGGRMLLYTGSAIVDGRDPLRAALEDQLPRLGCTLRYEEIDPDVFGEELDKPHYGDVERIAVVGAVISKD